MLVTSARRLLLRGALACTILATTGVAAAVPREALERFDEGRALLRENKPDAAIAKFLASIAVEPTVGAVLNLADCYERVGKLVSAHTRFRQAYEMSKDVDSVRATEARKRATLLEPRLSTVTLLPPAHPERTSVWLDGEPVAKEEWGKPRPFDGGKHELVVQDVSGQRHASTIDVPTERARMTVPLDAGVVEEPPTARPPGVTPPSGAPTDDGSGMRTLGIISAGAGVVGVGIGVVTGIVALGASSDLKDGCPAYPQCPTDRRGELVDLDDRARAMGTVSTVAFIAGSLLLVTGAVLWFGSPKRATSGRLGTFVF